MWEKVKVKRASEKQKAEMWKEKVERKYSYNMSEKLERLKRES